MTLRWDNRLAARVAAHAEAGYPREVCGILVGRRDAATEVTSVVEVTPTENAWADEDEHHHRFHIAPEVILREERRARALGLELVGFYHSHPDHPARPSATDREYAWPVYAYVIQAVDGGRGTDVACWRLRDDRTGYDAEAIEVVNETESTL